MGWGPRMEIEVASKKENVLLGRVEIEAVVTHEAAATPKREDVRKKLAQEESTNVDLVIVGRMQPEFGRGRTRAWLRVYKDSDTLKRLEAHHILVRHKLAEKKVKAAKESAPPKAPTAAAPAAPAPKK